MHNEDINGNVPGGIEEANARCMEILGLRLNKYKVPNPIAKINYYPSISSVLGLCLF